MKKTRLWLRYLLPVILILLSLSACKSVNTSTTSTSSPVTISTTTSTSSPVTISTQTSVSNIVVTISNFTFSPTPLNVKVGDTVTWINKDGVTHTVTSDAAGIFDSGNLAPNATFSYTFTSAGTFKYYCVPHPYMTGTVIVK